MSKFEIGDIVRVTTLKYFDQSAEIISEAQGSEGFYLYALRFKDGAVFHKNEKHLKLITKKENVVAHKEIVEELVKEAVEDMKLEGGGKRFNEGKIRLELLVPEAMEAEARVWAMGAKKYGEYNWQKGMPWLTVIGCLLRHILAILKGEDIDKESGELHAAHIKCNASMLIYYYYNYKQGDNRKPKDEN